MQLTPSQDILAGYKALILYIIEKVNKPINNTDLLNLVLSFDNMNYFYFQQFLLDLSENKYILSYTNKEGQTFYTLTETGKNDLPFLIDLIPGLVKFKVDSYFKDALKAIENSFSITADFIPKSENSYDVKCKIVEGNEQIFEIQAFARF